MGDPGPVGPKGNQGPQGPQGVEVGVRRGKAGGGCEEREGRRGGPTLGQEKLL